MNAILTTDERLLYRANKQSREDKEAANGHFVCQSFRITNKLSFMVFRKPMTDEQIHEELDQQNVPRYLEEVDPRDLHWA